MSENRVREPFLLVLLSVGVFVALSFIKTDFTASGYTARKVNVLADVVAEGRIAKARTTSPVINDSMQKKRGKFMKAEKHSSEIVEFGNDSLGGLIRFFMALEQRKTQGKTVRIAYFGDSMIEGDLISQDLRELMQDTFGGTGVGFMPITSIVAGFRTSVSHSFSKNWTDHNLLEKDNGGHGPGITGHTFIPPYAGSVDSTGEGAAWVSYTAASKRKHLDKFCNVRMFYSAPEGTHYVNMNQTRYKLENGSVQELLVKPSTPCQRVQASFSSSSPLDVYGFSLDSDSGVYVDNFSYRGNSGLTLTKMPYRVLSGLNKHLDYDLIILQYGPNVVNSKLKSYDWYEKGMITVVEHLKNAFPTASILIISTGDKGYRKNGTMGTDPAVPILIDAQRRTAEKTGSAFWNLFEAMGGEGSMIKWVQGDTVYANKDYTHFNHRGAKRIGQMLHNKLMSEYKLYKKSAT